MIKNKKIIICFLIIVIVLGIFTGCNDEKNKNFNSMEDFKQARIGVLTGSSFDLMANEYFPKAEKFYFMNMTELILNLQQQKIDGILMDKGSFTPLMWGNEPLASIEMDMPATEFAVAFPESNESDLLRSQINEFIHTKKDSGWINELENKWLSTNEPNGEIDWAHLSGENGTIRVATTVENKPFDYLKNGQYSGFDADFIFHFAKEYGYALEINTMDFGALLPSITSGRCDLAISSITVTEERKQSVLFSDTYCSNPVVMAVSSDDGETDVKRSLADLETARLGIVTGTNWDVVAQKHFPNAERKYFSSAADTLIALGQGKIDACFADKTVYVGMKWENPSIDCIDEPIETISNALILAKEDYDENLLAQINSFIAKAKEEGTLDYLSKKWFSDTEPSEHPDYTKLTGENGTLRVAIGDSMKPTAYQRGMMYTGYEVDFLTLFAQEYGYKLDMRGMAFEALIPSVSSGKCDIGACGITITPERSESVTFTDAHFETYGVAIIEKNASSVGEKKKLGDFENAVIGIQTGSVYEDYVKKMFPNAERKYFTLISDLILALEQGKIDGYIGENTLVAALKWEEVEFEVVDEAIDQVDAGYIFRKNSENTVVLKELNEFLKASKENGLLEELKVKWIAETEPTDFCNVNTLSGENGTLKVAISPDIRPMCYLKNGMLVGYDVEVLYYFAKEYGYKLDLHSITFDAILPGIISGIYDIGAGGITITEKRAESVDFSESNMTVYAVMITRKTNNTDVGDNLWNEVKESFNKTFIRENRWKLIVEGIIVTLIISIFSTIFGTLVGFALYLLSCSKLKALRKIAKGIIKVYSRIIAGTPVVVILMILFYVVFGNFRDISGILVAIIGFTLTFGAFVCDHMSVSVGSVDYAQTEAAYALGYTKNKTFFKIIIPQAMRIFLPSYCGQAVELIKATAVVGYIAVNDLTKMGDIIRSNTYEAFFPLIATAVIYFFLTWGLSWLLGFVKLHFEPKRRRKEDILKGVITK